MTAHEAIAKAEALLERCAAKSLEAHAFMTWRVIEQAKQDVQAVQDAIPAPDTLGREEIDTDTWETR